MYHISCRILNKLNFGWLIQIELIQFHQLKTCLKYTTISYNKTKSPSHDALKKRTFVQNRRLVTPNMVVGRTYVFESNKRWT
jgi:hypothetical protein